MADALGPLLKANGNILKWLASLTGGRTKFVFSSQSTSGVTQDNTGLLIPQVPAGPTTGGPGPWPANTPIVKQLSPLASDRVSPVSGVPYAAVSPPAGTPLTPAQIAYLIANGVLQNGLPVPPGQFNSIWSVLTNNGAGWGAAGSAISQALQGVVYQFLKLKMVGQSQLGGSGGGSPTATGVPSDVEFYTGGSGGIGAPVLDANGFIPITMDTGPLFNAIQLLIGDTTGAGGATAVYAIWFDHSLVN